MTHKQTPYLASCINNLHQMAADLLPELPEEHRKKLAVSVVGVVRQLEVFNGVDHE